jgi:hypothetical protein
MMSPAPLEENSIKQAPGPRSSVILRRLTLQSLKAIRSIGKFAMTLYTQLRDSGFFLTRPDHTDHVQSLTQGGLTFTKRGQASAVSTQRSGPTTDSSALLCAAGSSRSAEILGR